MSVYTPVSEAQLNAFLQRFDLGALLGFVGIRGGIENTNYFVNTEHGEFVLTLFEVLSEEQIPWFLTLMGWLAEHGVPAPHPVADRNGRTLHQLSNRPAALIRRLPGQIHEQPSADQCAELGRTLGMFHRVAKDHPHPRANDFGPTWRNELAHQLSPHLKGDEVELLRAELSYQEKLPVSGLPHGVIHGDLFRDNVLFADGKVSALLDFYNGCHDLLAYDLAVTINDWCHNPDGSLNGERLHRLMDTYQQQRPLTSDERRLLPAMLRTGALRFWLSRLRDRHFPRPGELTFQKDPGWFQQMLQLRRDESVANEWL